MSLLFIETRDIRTLPASPVVGTSIDGAIVLKVTKSDTEPKHQILFAIPEGEGIAETLARFANQIPAQITSAAA